MKTYISPALDILLLSSQEPMVDTSMTVSNEKVSNSEDIGFVKKNTSPNNPDVWDDDWSR